jgi:polyphosphate kinase 2 (PPK2 family)
MSKIKLKERVRHINPHKKNLALIELKGTTHLIIDLNKIKKSRNQIIKEIENILKRSGVKIVDANLEITDIKRKRRFEM